MTQRVAYRVKEFAEAIGVDRVTVWRWIKAGKLETIKVAGMTLIPATVCTPVSARNTVQPGATLGEPEGWLIPFHYKGNATQGN